MSGAIKIVDDESPEEAGARGWKEGDPALAKEVEILHMLRSCGVEDPRNCKQRTAATRAGIWAKENPYQAQIVLDYLDIHYPWWKEDEAVTVIGSGFKVGDLITVGRTMHRAIQMFVESISNGLITLTAAMDPVVGRMGQIQEQIQELGPEDGVRARKGQVRAPKSWGRFTKTNRRLYRRNNAW